MEGILVEVVDIFVEAADIIVGVDNFVEATVASTEPIEDATEVYFAIVLHNLLAMYYCKELVLG